MILIINDHQDFGHSYTPFFRNLSEITEDKKSFLSDPRKFKLIVFTGGADVSPSYYGDTSPDGLCGANPSRDAEEKSIFEAAKGANIPMFGICRGIQFLNAMAGGKLMHHIAFHTGGVHTVRTSDDMEFETNTGHHQMCIPPLEGYILAWSKVSLSDVYIGNKDEKVNYPGPEVESVYVPQFRIAGTQWHPEAMSRNSPAAKWAYHLARDLMNLSQQGFERIYLPSNLKVSYAS